jgi:hypothetical protein
LSSPESSTKSEISDFIRKSISAVFLYLSTRRTHPDAEIQKRCKKHIRELGLKYGNRQQNVEKQKKGICGNIGNKTKNVLFLYNAGRGFKVDFAIC